MTVLRALLRRLSWKVLLYLGLVLGGLALLEELVDVVYEEGGFFFDEPILAWFYGIISPPLSAFMHAMSVIGDVPVMLGVSVLVFGVLWFVARREALFFGLSMGGASLIMLVGKLVLNRERPQYFDVQLWEASSPSFPSGHATGSMALFLSLYLLAAHVAPRWKLPAAILGVVMVGLISASRLYLQVHYPSDILAGLTLGAVWVLGVNAFYLYHTRDRSERTVLLTLSSEVVARYQAQAEQEQRREDEVVDAALRAQFGLPDSEERPPSSAHS